VATHRMHLRKNLGVLLGGLLLFGSVLIAVVAEGTGNASADAGKNIPVRSDSQGASFDGPHVWGVSKGGSTQNKLPSPSSVGGWGQAEEVPGTATLNSGGAAYVSSVSCTSAGNCAAGGNYTGTKSWYEAFVANQTGGKWGKAEAVPGLAKLNAGAESFVNSVSCASAGNCAGGGDFYIGNTGESQAYVVNEAGATWGKAEEVPGLANLNSGDDASISSISCRSAGNCSAIGFYYNSSADTLAFAVDETDGTWGKAEEIRGLTELSTATAADGDEPFVVSCGSAGNCSAGGSYEDSSDNLQAFVVNETDGTWAEAKEVPGSAKLNVHGEAAVDSVSCASAGNCSAGGSYEDSSDNLQAFVVNETDGTWGEAKEVPGSAKLNVGGEAFVNSVSCASVGSCSAGGSFINSSDQVEAFVVNESSGTWGDAEEIPGSAAIDNGTGSSYVSSVSCASAGNCSAGGYKGYGIEPVQSFVVNEAAGTWGKAEQVPGLAHLDTEGIDRVFSLSCGSVGNCSAGGIYWDNSGAEAFVVSSGSST
jgi:hypothetical protein